MRVRRLTLPMLLVIAVAAGACSGGDGSDTGSSSSGRKKASVPFEGTNWVLTSGVSFGDATVTAQFTAGTVSGSSGCNTYRAPIARDGPKVEVTGPIAATQIACIGSVATVEQAYLAMLPEVRTYAIEGERLTLRNLEGKALLVYRAGGVSDILGDWTATSLYTGNAIQSVAIGTELTATFTKDHVGGSGGCNRYSGPATITRTTIALGPLAGTLTACPEPAGTQEQQYLNALELARTYEVRGDQLTLFRDGGTIAATFERA